MGSERKRERARREKGLSDGGRTEGLPAQQPVEPFRPTARRAEAHLAADLLEERDDVAQAPVPDTLVSSALARLSLERCEKLHPPSLALPCKLKFWDEERGDALLDGDVAERDTDAQHVEIVRARREGEEHGQHVVDALLSISRIRRRSIDTGSVSIMIFRGAILAGQSWSRLSAELVPDPSADEPNSSHWTRSRSSTSYDPMIISTLPGLCA
jgi:hypothetical protein